MSALAFVSGRLGRAVAIERDTSWVIPLSGTRYLTNANDVADIWSPQSEYSLIEAASPQRIEESLHEEVHFQESLFLLLSALDPDVSLSTKIACAQALEDALTNASLSRRLLLRLLSRPLPSEVRAHRRDLFPIESSFEGTGTLLRQVFGSQEQCDEVWNAWTEVTQSLDPLLQSELLAELTEDGSLGALVEAAAGKDLHKFNSDVVGLLLKRRDHSVDGAAKSVLKHLRDILSRRFFRHTEVQRPLLVGHSQVRRSKLDDPTKPNRSRRTEQDWGWARISAHEAKSRVDRQLAAINNELLFGRDDLADKYIRDLIEFQLSHSEQEHLGKSLCQLAAIAVDANRLDMADLLSERAIHLEIEDPVIFTARAEVLKNMGLFSAALGQYKAAKLRFPESDYAWVGVADVLREMGEFDLALGAYNDAQAQFPESPVPYNGFISVLRSQGNPRKAIAYAVRTAEKFPQDAVTRANLGGALREVGRYHDALRHYEAAIQLDGRNTKVFQSYLSTLAQLEGGTRRALELLEVRLRSTSPNPSLRNAKATLLRRAGDFEASIAASKELLRDFPKYDPARFTLASALASVGRPEEALAILAPLPVLRSELDWWGFRVYAAALIRSGEYVEATTRLSDAIKVCPWRRQLTYLKTTLGYAQMKLNSLDASVVTLESDLTRLDKSNQQTRIVLLSRVQQLRGNADISAHLSRMITTKDPLIVAARKSICSETDSPGPAEIQLLLAAA